MSNLLAVNRNDQHGDPGYQAVGRPRDFVPHGKPWFLSDGVGPARRDAFLIQGRVSAMLERNVSLLVETW